MIALDSILIENIEESEGRRGDRLSEKRTALDSILIENIEESEEVPDAPIE